MSEHNEEHSGDKFSDLRLENEIKKIKLALEHGGNLISSAGEDLPPEIESQWLDYIKKFEEELARRKKVLVYNLVGRPEYKLVDAIPDEDIHEELGKLKDLLLKHFITVDTVARVEDRELYRFITEEIFREETNDFHIEGMITCFIYEEYHPNHDYDIRNRCTEFIYHVLDKSREWAPDYLGLADEVQANNGVILTKKQATRKIIHFRESFSRMVIIDFNVHHLEINGDTAHAECTINCRATIEGSDEVMNFSGDCFFSLLYTSKLWVISRIDIPGIRL